jgi:NAD(P)H-flavin reductase
LINKITLCTSSSKGVPVKEAFYPISSPFSKSTFEVVVPSSETAGSKMYSIMSKLSLGDEIAFKLGKNNMLHSGSDTPIHCLTMVASGAGIIPLIQLLRRIFTGSSFNIDRCELLWINSKKEDFILNGEVEKFELDHGDKFVCARVLDSAMESNEYELNQDIQESLPAYEDGRVALLSASSEPLTTKFADALERLQYPSSDVLLLT